MDGLWAMGYDLWFMVCVYIHRSNAGPACTHFDKHGSGRNQFHILAVLPSFSK